MWKATQHHFPLIAALLSAAMLVIWRADLMVTVIDRGLSLSDLYSAVFNWSAIQTGFLFSVYGFIVAKTDGFIAAIKKTKAMSRFLGHLGRAMIAGFALTILSMGLVVLSPTPTEVGPGYFALAAWFSLFVWAFVAFLRVAYIFGQMARVPDNKDIPG